MAAVIQSSGVIWGDIPSRTNGDVYVLTEVLFKLPHQTARPILPACRGAQSNGISIIPALRTATLLNVRRPNKSSSPKIMYSCTRGGFKSTSTVQCFSLASAGSRRHMQRKKVVSNDKGSGYLVDKGSTRNKMGIIQAELQYSTVQYTKCQENWSKMKIRLSRLEPSLFYTTALHQCTTW